MILSFVIYLFVSLQVAALLGGVVSRLWPLAPPQLVWHGTSVETAAQNVQSFLWDVDDFRFAYPTGQFVADESQRDLPGGLVVMREANFKGSKGFGVIKGMFRAVFVWTASVMEGSLCWGLLAGLCAVYLVCWLALPFLIASVIDVAYRSLYRSQITAVVKKHPSIENAVTIDLTFRGLSSFGIVGDVLRGIAEPAPPHGTKAHADLVAEHAAGSARDRAAKWTGAAERRSSMIYGTGVATSVMVALLLATFTGHIGSSGGNDDYLGGASTSYASSSNSSSSGSDGSDDSGGSYDSGDGDPSEDGSTEPGFVSSTEGFSATPPGSWEIESDASEKGAYTETRWHAPGDTTLYGLVDHTPSYTGSAENGAGGVHDNVSKLAGYREITYEPDGDDAWRWEFVVNGVHKLDVFHSCPGGGYAILAAAPAGDWDAYSDDLNGFVDSFTCDDSASSSDGSASSDGEDGDGSGTSSDGFTYPATTLSGRMERAIRNHWQARLDGDYAKAYGYYTAPIVNRVGTEANWAGQLEHDSLTDVSFERFQSTETTPTRGQMDVSLRTTSDENGCQDWDFHYTLVHSSGRWLIADSTTDNTAC